MWFRGKKVEPVSVAKKVITEFEKAKQDKDGTWITIEMLVTPGVGWTTWHIVDLKGLSKEAVSKSLDTVAYNFLASVKEETK